MSIYILSSVHPKTHSGGGRYLFDIEAFLKERGLDISMIFKEELPDIEFDKERDVVILPEVWGDFITDILPRGIKRISFAQNGYLLDQNVENKANHPYMRTPDLIAVIAESEHTRDIIKERFPRLRVPIFRIRPSANGRAGKHAGFRYGEWPREKWIVSFDYKHELANRLIFGGLELPLGWKHISMSGMSDQLIQQHLRRASIFVAANIREGMCAPTAEATISGAVNVCWTGQGPDEYLQGRAVIAAQGSLEDLRDAIVETARDIDADWPAWAALTQKWSEDFQKNYSREDEIDGWVNLFKELGCA